ncbi:hypothetical protein BGZ83_002942 [Gryganskiella cystojenkinii]|nr:hypothetical protein BGZ83_002942 [Gryganskiella cystojenkinii]
MHSSSSASAAPIPHPSSSSLSGPRSHRSPAPAGGAYPTKRHHHLDSDSEGYSDQDHPEYLRGGGGGRGTRHPSSGQQQHPSYSQHQMIADQGYHRGAGPYQYTNNEYGTHPHHQRQSPLPPPSAPQQQQQSHASTHRPHSQDSLPALASRPLQQQLQHYPTEDEPGSRQSSSSSHPQHLYQNQQQPQPQSSSSSSQVTSPIKKEAVTPFPIQSARGTPKGPLPIDVQISLLSSVLNHDPFNCAIRKTTQAWESISREQGIRARTCSRRFDNIIQASIGGRDRPIGTEAQQATKKRLLEQLFEMMNQPQALKRMQKKRRYRSEDTDKQLLVETIRLNPFAQKVGQVAKAWEDVRDALKMKVHARQCIRRVNRMVKPYQLRERMYKGDIPEDMREANDDLVKQVIQLMRNAGQGPGALDEGEGCNSNDEDSASLMSDSEDQDDDGEAESKMGQQDELMEDQRDELDEDEDMVSRSESEQPQHHQQQQAHQSRRGKRETKDEFPNAATSSLSPPLPSAGISGSSSATMTSPAKRGRPRNPVNTTSSAVSAEYRPSSHSSADRTKSYPKHQLPYQSTSSSSAMAWESDTGFESKNGGLRSLASAATAVAGAGPGPEKRGTSESGTNSYWNQQQQGGISMLPPRPLSPPSSHSRGAFPAPVGHGQSHRMGHARHYSQGDSIDTTVNDYRRPVKHARTNSNGGAAVGPGGHMSYAPSPRSVSVHGMELERYPPPGAAPGYDDAPPYHPSHGPPPPPAHPHAHQHPQHHQHQPSASSLSSGSSSPQYREILNELHIMRDYLGQIDEYRRVEQDKQNSMMYQLEKMQIHIHQQQQQITMLQQQLEASSTTPTAATTIRAASEVPLPSAGDVVLSPSASSPTLAPAALQS